MTCSTSSSRSSSEECRASRHGSGQTPCLPRQAPCSVSIRPATPGPSVRGCDTSHRRPYAGPCCRCLSLSNDVEQALAEPSKLCLVYVPDGNAPRRSALRPAHDAPEPRLHRHCSGGAGPRHRRQHGDLHGRGRRPPPAAAVPAARPNHEARPPVSHRRRLFEFHPQVHGVAAERCLRRHGAVRFRGSCDERGLGQSAPDGEGSPRLRGLLQGLRRFASRGSHLLAKRGSAERPGRGRDQLCRVAISPRRHQRGARAANPAERRALHSRRHPPEGLSA